MGRIEKVNQQVKREIGRILQRELSDPRLTFVSITRVSVSKDLRSALVFFSVLGETAQTNDAQNALNSARGMIRKILGASIRMRFTPELHFKHDDSIGHSIHIEETLKELYHDEERPSGD